uniref:Uncharacterized protein n=1 Tax=viral metagenome TaxID=1070528 RepID=A0A2V0RIE9_9ZZZZ
MRAAHKGYSKVRADFEQCDVVPTASQKLFADIEEAYNACTTAFASLYPDNAEDFKSDAPDKVTTGKRLDEIEAKLTAVQETGSTDHAILKKVHKMLIKVCGF